ncbi:MAG: gamma-glutamyltransferase, partial [Chloroflexi bacterium]|nr:gamma-glutamyltransferase [Chloroflexota bacterium]
MFNSRRSAVYANGGMVASSQPLATQAGLATLMAGGNAADAAIAVAAVLQVTEPCSTGLGGDAFALYYDAGARRVSALNGSGRAPAALTLERIAADGFAGGLPPYHPHTVTVPGAAAAWCDLVEEHGSMPLGDVLTPAIRLAERGFPVAPLTSFFWRSGARRQLAQAPGGHELTLDGEGPLPGQI